MELTPGMIIAGRYRVEHRVGAGGMGEVWAGEHMAVGTRVALKTLLPAAAYDHEIVARFKREAYFLGRIRSDHVARVVDFVADEAVGLVLVMEFIEGTPLSHILQARSLSVEDTVELGVDVVSALCDLHRSKIIHRDLKPGNIIMKPMPDGSTRAIIVDFGVSRAVPGGADDDELTGITRADMAVGTMEYMAPEQILNSRDVTAVSDLYAVGALLYRAVAGRHLFGEIYDADLAKKKLTADPPPLQTGRTDRVAQGLELVVGTALQRRPKNRYSTADRMLAELIALRDLARALSLDFDQATTQDVRGSADGIRVVSQPELPRPTWTSAVPSYEDLPKTHRQSPAPQHTHAPSQTSSPEIISTSPAPLSPRPATASVPDADAIVPELRPRRPRSVSLAAAVALSALALAGGAGLGSTWTQRKLSGATDEVTAKATDEAAAPGAIGHEAGRAGARSDLAEGTAAAAPRDGTPAPAPTDLAAAPAATGAAPDAASEDLAAPDASPRATAAPTALAPQSTAAPTTHAPQSTAAAPRVAAAPTAPLPIAQATSTGTIAPLPASSPARTPLPSPAPKPTSVGTETSALASSRPPASAPASPPIAPADDMQPPSEAHDPAGDN